MSNKLTKIQKGKEIAEGEINQTIAEVAANEQALQTAMMLGAVTAVDHIANNLNAQAIRGLQQIRDLKSYEGFGFKRFDDFLNEFPHSPMTYRQFNEREKILMTEGDELFNILNQLRLSNRKRKLLGAGNVTIDGSVVTIKAVSPDGEELAESIEIDDRDRLLQTLSALADQNAKFNHRTERQKKQIEKQDMDISELQYKLEQGQFVGTGEGKHFEGFMRAVTSLDAFTKSLKKDISKTDREKHAEVYLQSIYAAFCRVRQAYGRNDLRFADDDTENNEFAEITSMMNEDELADLID